MDIAGKLAPLVSQAQKKAVEGLQIAEGSLLKIPRPFRKLQIVDVGGKLGTAAGTLVIASVSLRTGKATMAFGVKNRELNKVGRVSLIIQLVVQSAVIVIASHEAWARLREPQTLEGYAEELFQHLSRESAAG